MAKRILRTKLCDMLGIEYPIILAGMAGIAGPQLVAAVSNAGGMGVLGVSGFTAEQLQDWIRKTKTLTDKPFGVDLLLPAMRESGTRETFKAELPAEHVTMINKWKEELGVPDAKARGQSILTIETVKKKVEVIMEEGVAAFACGLGTPEWVVPQLHGGGIKVISLVGNIKQARRVAERGTDIVVAQGHEAVVLGRST